MSRPRRFLALPLLTACLWLLSGCMGLEQLAFDDIAIETEGLATDLESNPDPEVQAAAAASQEIQKDKEAQHNIQSAIANNRLEDALEAVELRPLDPLYHLQFGALLVANGDIANAHSEFGTAGALMSHDGYNDAERYELAVVSLLEVRNAFDPGSQPWNRVHTEYCTALKAYRRVAPQTNRNVLDNIMDIAALPDEGCS